jgi:hypothetical protein
MNNTTSFENAQRTAARLNKYVKDPKITYEPLEIKPKFNPYEDDGELMVPQYRVVQKYDGQIVWFV